MSRVDATIRHLRRRAEQLTFAVVALPIVLRACWRLWRLDRGHARLDELAQAMSRVAPLRAGWLRRPRLLAGCVDRLGSVLPPYGYGRCLKRSLLLLDLWGRCELEPSFHLGVRREGPERRFHAWLELEPSPETRRHQVLWTSDPS